MTSLRLTSLLLCLATSSATAGNWPQWRGPNNDGISPETNLPTEWAEGKNILWKVPLPGMGSSTPCIFGDKIFLTSESKTGVVAMCISTSGKELWSHQLGAVSRVVRSDEGNGASASPSTDGKHVWFFAGSGELACYDFDGKEIWKINCQEKFGKFKIQFGMHSTPALYEGKLYLQFLHDNGQQVICVDAATGDEVWKINRSSDGRAECLHSYASPFIWKNGKEAYLVAHGNDYATAHSLKDGSEILASRRLESA
jgi:outer membrane protein assembly factor BamB